MSITRKKQKMRSGEVRFRGWNRYTRVAAIVAAASLEACAGAVGAVAGAMYPERARQGTVEVSYDRFDQTMNWSLVPMSVTDVFVPGQSRGGQEIQLGVRAIAVARDSIPVREVGLWLTFYSTSSDWQYLKCCQEIALIVDGERIHLAPVKYSGDVGQGAYVTEQLAVRISRALLKRLGEASRVEARVGMREVRIGPLHAERLREFERRLPSAFAFED